LRRLKWPARLEDVPGFREMAELGLDAGGCTYILTLGKEVRRLEDDLNSLKRLSWAPRIEAVPELCEEAEQGPDSGSCA